MPERLHIFCFFSSASPQLSGTRSEPTPAPVMLTRAGTPLKQHDELRIVLVGKAGIGKSACGNTILGRECFESRCSPRSLTVNCTKEVAVVDGQRLAVIDTPGLTDTSFGSAKTAKDLSPCISFSAPGPHVFLVVVSLSRFTEAEKQMVKRIQEVFGEAADRYCMVLFTHGDLLEDETMEEYLADSPDLQDLVSSCNNQFHVFNNRLKDKKPQVVRLLQKIRHVVQKNGGSHYGVEMFREAEKGVQQEKQRRQREQEEERRRRTEAMEREIEEKCKTELKNLTDEVETLQKNRERTNILRAQKENVQDNGVPETRRVIEARGSQIHPEGNLMQFEHGGTTLTEDGLSTVGAEGAAEEDELRIVMEQEDRRRKEEEEKERKRQKEWGKVTENFLTERGGEGKRQRMENKAEIRKEREMSSCELREEEKSDGRQQTFRVLQEVQKVNEEKLSTLKEKEEQLHKEKEEILKQMKEAYKREIQSILERAQNERDEDKEERRREMAAMMAAFNQQREREVKEQEGRIRNAVEKNARRALEMFQEAQKSNEETRRQIQRERESDKVELERKMEEMCNKVVQKVAEQLRTERERRREREGEGEEEMATVAAMDKIDKRRGAEAREQEGEVEKNAGGQRETFQGVRGADGERRSQPNVKQRVEKINRKEGTPQSWWEDRNKNAHELN